LGQEFALINLGRSGDLAAFGHRFDEFSHVGESAMGVALFVVDAGHEKGEGFEGGKHVIGALFLSNDSILF
jgi:hypothetical protein